MDDNLKQLLETGKLYRHVNALIIAHLRQNNLNQAAAAVASATMMPLDVVAPSDKLLHLVAKGLAVEREGSSQLLFSSGGAALNPSAVTTANDGQVFPPPAKAIDFSALQDVKGSSKVFPKHETKHLSEHKNDVCCARFSGDGQFFATGSADTSIKLFEVSKVKQTLLPDTRDGPIRPVIRTFYDHSQSINDLDFHPQGNILISGAEDRTIKFFDYSKAIARRAFRVIQDTHNVRSVAFHPSGDFLLAGTDHHIPHIYDINTFQCYLPPDAYRLNINAGINQVRYSATGNMYVTASKDGVVRVWDTTSASAQCVRSFDGAHGVRESTSAMFTKDQRFVLSCGQDSTAKLWEVGTGRLVKQYLGAAHMQLPCQAVFNETEEFVLCIDEQTNEIVVWDSLTSERVARWPTNHLGAPQWLEHSPTESNFISCGTDRSVRIWKKIV